MEQISRRDAIRGMVSGLGVAGLLTLDKIVLSEEVSTSNRGFYSSNNRSLADGLTVMYKGKKGDDKFKVFRCTERGEKVRYEWNPSLGISNGINGSYAVEASPGYPDRGRYGTMELKFQKGTRHGNFDITSSIEGVNIVVEGGSVVIESQWNPPTITIEKYGSVQSGNLSVSAQPRVGQPRATQIGMEFNYSYRKPGATALNVVFLGVPYFFQFTSDGKIKPIKRKFVQGESSKFGRVYTVPFDEQNVR